MKRKSEFEMSESELADYIEELIEHKLEKQHLPVDVSAEAVYYDIYKHMRIYIRLLQLQLNYIKAQASLGKYFAIAMGKTLPEDLKEAVWADIKQQKEADDEKIRAETRTPSPSDSTQNSG